MLLLAALEDGPRHGYAVKEALREGSGGRFDLPTGTIYPALHRLESAGLIAGSWSTVDGRRRRTYRLTAGRPAAAARRPQQLARVRRRDHHPAGDQAMASHQLIDAHLAVLARRLPADAVEELADGLTETWQHHLAAGLPPTDAARAAIAEFGSADADHRRVRRAVPGRRTARLLLATGPVVGVCWGASLVASHAWSWPIPAPAAAAFGLALLAVVAALIASATSRHSYRRTRLGDVGGLGLVALDVAMVAAVLLVAPTLVWPMFMAVPASLARIGLALRSLPRARAH